MNLSICINYSKENSRGYQIVLSWSTVIYAAGRVKIDKIEKSINPLDLIKNCIDKQPIEFYIENLKN